MRPSVLRAGNVLAVGGFLMFLASAVVMVVFWVITLAGWIGWPGIVVGIASAPVAVVYPFVMWVVEGSVPMLALAVWLAGIVGMLVSMIWVATATSPPPSAPGGPPGT